MGRRCGHLWRPFLRNGGLFGQTRYIGVHQRTRIGAGRSHASFFLGGLVGLGSRLLLGGELSYVRETGFVLGCLGTMVGLVYEIIHTVTHAVGLEHNF
jgi:hypothetical protein